MEESFQHYGIYYDQYQAFVLPLLNDTDLFVSHLDVLPGNREIVRSANLSIAEKGISKYMDEWDPKYGFYAYGSLGFEPILPNWYTWMPNTEGLEINKNEVAFLPKDSDLILHIHYGPFGEIQNDSTCVGLVYEKAIRKKQLQNVPYFATEFLMDTFFLKAGLKKRISSTFYIPENTYIKSITPLSHLLCTKWEVFAILPDKSSIPLLSIPDWDFHWREKYVFTDYIFLPKGTRIVGTATYDNTSKNPYNPSDPPHSMKKGPHMFDENFLCYTELLSIDQESLGNIEKPFTVTTNKLNRLKFTCQKEALYKLTLYDLTNNSSNAIIEKKYPKGQHTYKSSTLPSKKGRYAISISVDGENQDTWYFVIK